MSLLPPFGLQNTFYLGDTVALTGVAEALAESLGAQVYIISAHKELLLEHPTVQGLSFEDPVPDNLVSIDVHDGLVPTEEIDGKKYVVQDRLGKLYAQAGLSPAHIRAPTLYLSAKEQERAQQLRQFFQGSCVGVVLQSRHSFKDWPYVSRLIRLLRRAGCNVFVIGTDANEAQAYVQRYGVHNIVGFGLRDLLVHLSMMDLVIGPDTGPMHMASALYVPTLVIVRELYQSMYAAYEDCRLVTTPWWGRWALHWIRPRSVFRHAMEMLPVEPEPDTYKSARGLRMFRKRARQTGQVALFRLDGFGGTITLADHAKKIYELTGMKSTLIVRGCALAFRDNPYVREVVEVGYLNWHEVLEEMKERYSTLAEIRFAPAIWHQSGGTTFDQESAPAQELFDAFPDGYRDLEEHGLHHVQLTDKYLGLPYDSIDMDIYYFEEVREELPDDYVVITNGVDAQHGSMRQTKVWNNWAGFVDICPIPVVQAGMERDPYVAGAIDLRGKTNLPQFFSLLKNAKAVLCTEGGTMHAAYAVKKSAIILRGPTRGVLFEYPGQRLVDSYICDICWSSVPDWYGRCPKDIGAACMETITPERVLYNLEEAVSGY
jgi:ADP-heptose:LPS heptosyltransferase